MEHFTLVEAKRLFLENLKFFMDKEDISPSELGRLCGFSRQQASNLFNESNNLTLNTTDKIHAALKLRGTDLFQVDFKKRHK